MFPGTISLSFELYEIVISILKATNMTILVVHIRNFIIILQYFIYRYSHPTVTSGARPEYIPLSQQPIMTRPYEHDMSKSYSPGTVYGQATSPGRR